MDRAPVVRADRAAADRDGFGSVDESVGEAAAVYGGVCGVGGVGVGGVGVGGGGGWGFCGR